MINKWILDNFKSIDKEKELEFRPLTIFTGANSSGKSTILQSILLVTQTLQNQSPSKSIVLNGWFKKFGTYSDIVFGRDINKNITIGFSLSGTDPVDSFSPSNFRFRVGNRIITMPTGSVDGKLETDCRFSISAAGIKNNLQPEMERVSISVMRGETCCLSTDVARWDIKTELDPDIYEVVKDKIKDQDVRFCINENKGKGRELLPFGFYDEVRWSPIGVTFNHFLPSQKLSYCSKTDIVKMRLENYMKRGASYFYDIEDIEEEIFPYIQDKAKEIVNQLISKNPARTKAEEKSYTGITKKLTLKRLRKLFANIALGDDERNKYISQIVEQLNDMPPEYELDMRQINGYEFLSNITGFFRDKIKYLGPLREEPRSLYPLGNDGSTSEVGLKGENTAAVFFNNKDNIVTYVAPCSFEKIEEVKLEGKKGTLAQAVTEWLQYMGVANEVITDDLGKIGHMLQISGELGINQDLTNVGVGVSQVLPVLVMTLLAEEGETIIMEQPELHLHPKVQTRLADFFVSMNALGKQCIVETHSEYLINRLRYLVAVSDNQKIMDDTMIYFVEKKEGHSKYRPVTINKYGVIEDWPDGFFDESEKIAAEILRAGMEKRMQEMGDDEDDE